MYFFLWNLYSESRVLFLLEFVPRLLGYNILVSKSGLAVATQLLFYVTNLNCLCTILSYTRNRLCNIHSYNCKNAYHQIFYVAFCNICLHCLHLY